MYMYSTCKCGCDEGLLKTWSLRNFSYVCHLGNSLHHITHLVCSLRNVPVLRSCKIPYAKRKSCSRHTRPRTCRVSAAWREKSASCTTARPACLPEPVTVKALNDQRQGVNNVTTHCRVLCFCPASCPKLEAPLNGKRLGKVLLPGHEVHFLCDSGYELVGSETRQCKESLTWSGQQAACRGQ